MCATPVADGGKPHNSLPCMRHGDKPCHRHPGIPRFQSWEVSNLCIEQIAEFVGDILAVTDDSCRLVDGREFREAVCRVVVADGIDGNVHACNDILCLRELITGIAITIRQDKDDWRAISAEFLRFFIDTVHCNTKTVIHSGIAVRVEGIYSTLVQIGIDSLNGATP